MENEHGSLGWQTLILAVVQAEQMNNDCADLFPIQRSLEFVNYLGIPSPWACLLDRYDVVGGGTILVCGVQATDVRGLRVPLAGVPSEESGSAEQHFHAFVRGRALRGDWNGLASDELAHLSDRRIVHQEEQQRRRNVQDDLRDVRLVAELELLLDLWLLDLGIPAPGVQENVSGERLRPAFAL